MFLEIVIILIIIIAVFVVAGKYTRTQKKGGIVGRHFRPFQRYINFQKLTIGRIAGVNGIEKQGAEHSRIRYKTGFFSYAIDENIPNWAIQELTSPYCPENIVVVRPFLPHTRHVTDQDDYLIQINQQDRMLKTLISAMTKVKETLSTQGNTTVAQDQMKRMADMIKDLKEFKPDLKTKTETTTIETPQEQKKTT